MVRYGAELHLVDLHESTFTASFGWRIFGPVNIYALPIAF